MDKGRIAEQGTHSELLIKTEFTPVCTIRQALMKVRKVYPSMKFVKVALYTVPIWIAVYVIILGMLYSNQRSMLYSPPKVSEEQIATGALKNINQYMPQHRMALKLRGFFHAPADQSKPVILAFHGNASHPLWMVHDFNDMVETGYGVLLAEYRGYGGNQGHPTEEGIYLDAEAFFKARVEKNTNNKSTLLFTGNLLGRLRPLIWRKGTMRKYLL